MAALLRITRAIDTFNERIGKVVAWAIVVAILVSAINAIIRRIFGVSSNAWLELQWYLFGGVFMLCAPWTLKANEHIRIDIVSNMLSKRGRDWIDLFGHLFFLFPFVALMIYLVGALFLALVPVGRGVVQCRRPADLARQGAHPPGLLPARPAMVQRVRQARRRSCAATFEDDAPTTHSAEAEAERLLAELGDAVTPHGGEPPGDGVR